MTVYPDAVRRGLTIMFLLVAALWPATSATAADDERPCVSKSELVKLERVVKRDREWLLPRVEAYAEVDGLGQLSGRADDPFIRGVIYPTCIPGRQIVVYYDRDYYDRTGAGDRLRLVRVL